MALQLNTENFIQFKTEHGPHKGNNYLYVESDKRWVTLKNYTKVRPPQFEGYRYFLVLGLQQSGKWEYGNYSNKPSSEKVHIPELIYDLKLDKVYEFKGQLWMLPK